jgi:hypothetical protein
MAQAATVVQRPYWKTGVSTPGAGRKMILNFYEP